MIYFQVDISVERYFLSWERSWNILSMKIPVERRREREVLLNIGRWRPVPWRKDKDDFLQKCKSIMLKLTQHWVQKIQVWGPHMMAWEGHSSRRVRCSLASELRSWLRVLGHHKMVLGHRTKVWGGFCFLYHDSWSDLGKEWMVWLALIHQRC